MMKHILTIAAILVFADIACAQTGPELLPRMSISAFKYQGAFRLPADTYGISDMNYAQGPVAYKQFID